MRLSVVFKSKQLKQPDVSTQPTSLQGCYKGSPTGCEEFFFLLAMCRWVRIKLLFHFLAIVICIPACSRRNENGHGENGVEMLNSTVLDVPEGSAQPRVAGPPEALRHSN